MNTKTLVSAAVMALSLSTSAHAVHLDPGGRGQVLIYPYYTVNKQQQTLVSVTNTSSVAQAVKVRFNEGYNGRDVLDFNVFLAPFDSWTGTIFALTDAGIQTYGNGAAILSADTSCTAPLFSDGDGMINGIPYVAFRDFLISAPDDGGPYSIDRTREGYVEIYAMADVAAPLAAAIAHGSNGSAPTGCAQVRNLLPDNIALSTPTGGLMGSVSIIDVAQGTYLSARAEALAGFTGSKLFTGPENIFPNLQDVNDGVGPTLANRATARIFDANGRVQTLTYPGTDARSRKVDAVSALFMADRVYNEYQIAASLGAASDWLLTMPTKPFYVDPQYTGGTAITPFGIEYDGSRPGTSQYSPALFSRLFYSRQGIESGTFNGSCGFTCPSLPGPPSFARTVNVSPVQLVTAPILTESAVLGSRLLASIKGHVYEQNWRLRDSSGWMRFNLDEASTPHALLPSAEGKVLRGLPVIGFWASNIVNNNVSNGVLANYAAAVRHATSVTCVKASDSTPCD